MINQIAIFDETDNKNEALISLPSLHNCDVRVASTCRCTALLLSKTQQFLHLHYHPNTL